MQRPIKPPLVVLTYFWCRAREIGFDASRGLGPPTESRRSVRWSGRFNCCGGSIRLPNWWLTALLRAIKRSLAGD
jgi:hypothetical protein